MPSVAALAWRVEQRMAMNAILAEVELGFSWPTLDPFLFCVHHLDRYPQGDDAMGPAASLAGRDLGMDFTVKDGWRMYHGQTIPGFPRHPHRGFETITLARQGYIDHSDSLGATARFGHGDVQWMTAGGGIEHAEMFPLVRQDSGNTTELFQIWINLPRTHKMVDPYFTMLWAHTIPRMSLRDDNGRGTRLATIAGSFPGEQAAPPPPPNSWAAQPEAQVAVWTAVMEPGATVTLPGVAGDVHRTIYFFQGDELRINDHVVTASRGVQVQPDMDLTVTNGETTGEFLMLQGRPIGEPVVQSGPFVMNTAAEIRQTMADYRRTRFGRWPWPKDDPVHNRDQSRFAIHADGRKETPPPVDE